jgi:hypothetical protein
MKKCMLVVVLCFLILCWAVQILCYAQRASKAPMKTRQSVDCPDVPRISADEAYGYYMAGKAVLIQADGRTTYANRHILGALNYPQEAVMRGKERLPEFPRRGKLIITFCY